MSLCFHASYTVKETEEEIVAAMRRRGLARSLSRNFRCIVSWAPFSKIDWKRAFGESLVVSAFYVHSGLALKARLFEATRGRRLVVEAKDETQSGVTRGELAELFTEDDVGATARMVDKHDVVNRVTRRQIAQHRHDRRDAAATAQ